VEFPDSQALHLRLLGATELRATDAKAAGRVLSQPKRLALLAYLAIARPSDYVQRDELTALLWSRKDDTRARTSLRQALSFLRRNLGKDLFQVRGDALRLTPGVLRTDLDELRQALEDGDTDQVLALYAGELMPAFFVSDSPEWERWLDRERLSLGHSVLALATASASDALERNEPARTVAWCRRALIHWPSSEGAARILIDAYCQMGDLAAAEAVFEEVGVAVRETLGREPASGMRGSIDDALDREPASSGGEGAHDTTRPRAWVAAAAATAFGAAVIALALGAARDRTTDVRPSPSVMAIRTVALPTLGSDSTPATALGVFVHEQLAPTDGLTIQSLGTTTSRGGVPTPEAVFDRWRSDVLVDLVLGSNNDSLIAEVSLSRRSERATQTVGRFALAKDQSLSGVASRISDALSR